MDWFSLIAEIGARDRADSLGDESDALQSTSVDESFEEFEKVEGSLDPLEAASVACILDISALQFHVLESGTSAASASYSVVTTRKKLLDVIQDTEYELRKSRTFEALYQRAKEEAASKKQAGILKEIALKHEKKIKALRTRLRGNERTKQKELNKRQETIASLKDQIQEIVTKSDIKLRYIDRWEAARQGQNRMRCEDSEVELKQKLEGIKESYDTEVRVHEEMCAFLVVAEKQLEDQITKWKETYVTEMKRRQDKLNGLQAKRKEEQIRLRELTELYEEHQKEINDYLDYKEQKRLEAEHDKFIYDMVTKIQAWWRGTMVRRGLGPYKKRKKLGKEKKKKK